MSPLTDKLLFAIAVLLGLGVVGLFSRSAGSQALHPVSPVGRYQLSVAAASAGSGYSEIDHTFLTDTQTGRVWMRHVSYSPAPGVPRPAGSTLLGNGSIVMPDKSVIPGVTKVEWIEESPAWARTP